MWPHSGPPHHRGNQRFNVRRANLLHHSAGFDTEQLQSAVDAGLAEGAQAPDIRPADANRGRAHAQGLHNVRAAANPAVEKDFGYDPSKDVVANEKAVWRIHEWWITNRSKLVFNEVSNRFEIKDDPLPGTVPEK